MKKKTDMKNKKVMITVIVAVIAVAAVIVAAVLTNRSILGVENQEDGSILVTAQNAAPGSGGVGYITLTDEQIMEVQANLRNGSAIRMEVRSRDTETVLVEETFTGIDIHDFAIPAGEYTINFTVEKKTTGNMSIAAAE